MSGACKCDNEVRDSDRFVRKKKAGTSVCIQTWNGIFSLLYLPHTHTTIKLKTKQLKTAAQTSRKRRQSSSSVAKPLPTVSHSPTPSKAPLLSSLLSVLCELCETVIPEIFNPNQARKQTSRQASKQESRQAGKQVGKKNTRPLVTQHCLHGIVRPACRTHRHFQGTQAALQRHTARVCWSSLVGRRECDLI